MKRSVLSFLLLLFLGKGYGQIPAAQLQDTLDFYRPVFNVTGASAAILFPDETLWTGTSGWSDTINGNPIDTSMVFAIGSITKTYVATLLLKLMEQGLITSLNDTLGMYLSLNHPYISNQITLRQLLDHTSGLYDFATDTALAMAVIADPTYWWPPDSALAYVKAPYFAPGTGFQYSNTNYLLLGLIAKSVLSVDTLGAYLRDSLLLPNGCYQSFFFPEMHITAPLTIAHPHLDTNGTPQTQEDISFFPRIAIHSVAWAAGCMYATPQDVVRFMSKLFTNQILSPASLNLMTQFNSNYYGLGVGKGYYKGYEFWGHQGMILGYTAIYLHVPMLKITLCLLTNNHMINVGGYASKLLDVAMTYVLTNTDPTATLQQKWKLTPNPVSDRITVTPVSNPVTYTIYSVNGQVAQSGTLTPFQPTIDVTALPPGVYFLHLSNPQTEIVEKFIKQ